MKRITAIALCLLLTLCAGCAARNGVADETVSTVPTPETSAPAETPAPLPEPEPVPPEEPAAPAPEAEPTPAPGPAFDTAGADNKFEALLPALPFTGWEITGETDTTMEMELTGLDTDTLTDADGNVTGFGADKEALIAYLEGLAAYDFSVEEVGGIEGYPYAWQVFDPMGNEFGFTCAEGFCRVTFRLVG